MRAILPFLLTLTIGASASAVQWVGDTRLTVPFGQLPNRAGFTEPGQGVNVFTETWPVADGQRVFLIATTDSWRTQREVEFRYDGPDGNNSRWRVDLPAQMQGIDLQFYIRAEGNGQTRFDNNGTRDFHYTTRHAPAGRKFTGAILQWFETDYRTMLRRLPEVVKAGYGAIYLPPPSKAGGGTFSAGYNPIDQFDLGDRLLNGAVRTRYGTTQELIELIRAAKRMGLEVYCDLIVNHNDNRASNPINRYPNQIPEDFHIRSSSDTSNNEIDFNRESSFTFGMLNHELVGLVDIAHEDGNNTRTGPFNLPGYATFNAFDKPSFVRNPLTPQLYPGGVPVAEDVREYLRRWVRWLAIDIGFDGFRIDAVKHVPPSFFDSLLDQPGSRSSRGDLLPLLYAARPDLFIFGEDLSTVNFELKEYARTGMQLLDFVLKSNLDNVMNSSGFGNLGAAFGNGYGVDPNTGLPFETGGLGPNVSVSFVQSHDQLAPFSSNLAHALVLTRAGVAKVYHDGNNVDPNNGGAFPRPGRGDALGFGDDVLLRLLDIRQRYARGFLVPRWSSQNLVIYERQVNGQGVLLVGLNNRGDSQALTATVNTAFAPGTVLVDLIGRQPNVTVDAQGRATITVPSNTENGRPANNGRGYVMYGVRAPQPGAQPIRLLAGGEELPFQTFDLPGGRFATGSTFEAVVTDGRRPLSVRIATDAIGVSAALKLNQGVAMAGRQPLVNTPEALTDGYVLMDRLSPGVFELSGIDVSGLANGLHVFRARVFADTGSRPGVFREIVGFFYLQRPQRIAIDGELDTYGQPIASQTRTPTSNQNRLDALYVTNDDRFLYVGLAGTVSADERFTNGIALLMQPDGASSGVRDMATLADDGGPAGRLLSNARITLPSGFSPGFGLATLRRSTLGSSPEASAVGQPTLPTPIGASAGLFAIDPNRLAWLEGRPSAIGFKPRTNRADPPRGLEAAIPLTTLFGPTVGDSAQIRFLAYLLTTGEAGTVLLSTDERRGQLGGRPEAISFVTNQFLPGQGSVSGDPGTSPVSADSFATYTLREAGRPAGLDLILGVGAAPGARGTVRVPFQLRNRSAQAIQGPIHIRVKPGSGVELVNRTGQSLRDSASVYVTISEAAIPVGGGLDGVLEFRVAENARLNYTAEPRTGMGVL